jgi:hypothetical protein
MRTYINEHFKYISIMVAGFIVIETAVLYSSAKDWWKPVVGVIAIILLALLWSHARVLMKSFISIFIMGVASMFAVMSGYSLTGSAAGGTIWGAALISAYATCIACSLYLVSTRSKWMASLVSVLLAFVFSYSLMPFGILVVSISAFITTLVFFFLIMKVSIIPSRIGKSSPHIIRQGLWKDTESIRTGMSALTRKYKYGTLPGKYDNLLCYGENLPTYVFIPMVLDAEFKENKHGRLSYHRKSVLPFMLFWTYKFRKKIKSDLVIVFVDTMGWNNDTKDEPRILALPVADGNNFEYVGMMDGTGSERMMQSRVKDTYLLFANAPVSSARDVLKIRKTIKDDIEPSNIKEK